MKIVLSWHVVSCHAALALSRSPWDKARWAHVRSLLGSRNETGIAAVV